MSIARLISSYAKGFLGIALRGSVLNGFSVFIYLIISSSLSEELLASEKDFEQFFPITTLSVCLNTFAELYYCITYYSINSITYYCTVLFPFARDDEEENDAFR